MHNMYIHIASPRKFIERLQDLANNFQQPCTEFGRIRQINVRGCELFFSKEVLWLSYPVSHMAPPTPSAGISVSVCGRSGQCFRSYPRNYTSVWLSAPTPGPQDVGTRYQTLIACRAHPSSIQVSTPTSSCLARFTSSLSFRLLSRRITDDDVP